ncbi:unnamed protein product [Toxocara canis]|uniref:Non-specific serine/threonine protein kinase n=1 Tax=Toxocara canis TaxID=6265 RepID=A0A183TVW3_TOXCA|nr:unnamed protein product [Toxocara canis]
MWATTKHLRVHAVKFVTTGGVLWATSLYHHEKVFAAQGSRTQSKRAGISEGEKRSRTSSRSSSVVEKNSQQNARRTQKSHARCQINYGHNASEDFNSRKLMTCCVGMEKAMRTKNQKFPKTSSGEAKRSIGMKHSRMRGWTRALSPPPTNNLRGRLEVQAHFAKTKHRNYERSRSPKNDERYVTPLDRAPSKTYGTRDTIETCVRRERNKTLGSLALSQTSISQERGRSHERCTASKTSLSCNRCKGPVYLERSKSGTNRTPRKTGTRRSRVQLSSSSEDLATEKELSRKRGRPHSKVSNATSDPPEFRCTAEQESPRKCARSLNKTFIALSDVPEFRCTTEKVPFRKCQRSLNKTFTALSDLPGRQRAAEKELSRKRRQSLNKTFTASSDLPEIQRATERESSKKRQRSLNKAFTASSDLPELRHATERGSSIKHRRSRSKASTDSSDGSQFYETIAERAMLNRRLSTQRSHPELKSCSRDESKNGKKLNDSGARPGAKKMMEDLPKMVSDEMAKQRGHSKKMSSSNHCLSRKRSDAIQNPMAETSSNLSKRKGHQDGTLGEARKYKSTCSSSEIEDEFVVTKERADQDEHFFRKIFRAMWNNIMVAWKEKRKQCMNHDNDYGLCRCNMLIADAFWSGVSFVGNFFASSDEDEDNGQTKQDGRHGTDEHEQIPTQTDQATSRAQEAVERARVRVGEVAGRLQSVQGTTRRRMDARRRFLKQAEQAARDEEAIRNMQHAESATDCISVLPVFDKYVQSGHSSIRQLKYSLDSALFSSQQMMQEEASSEMSDNSDVRLNGDPSGIVQWSAPAANGFTAGDDILRDPRRVQKRVCVESQASNFIGVFEGPARIEPALPGDKQQLSDDSREQAKILGTVSYHISAAKYSAGTDSASVTTIYVEDRAKPNHATTIEECLRAQLTNGSEVCLSGDSEEVGNVSEQWRSSFIQHAVSTSGITGLSTACSGAMKNPLYYPWDLAQHLGSFVQRKRKRTCRLCRNHGLVVDAHARSRCSWRECTCEKVKFYFVSSHLDSESTVGSRSTISGDSDEVRDEILSASDSTNDDGARIDEPKNVQENSARFVTRAEDSVISEQSRAAPITQRAESPLPQSQLATSKLQSILGDDAIARLSDCEVTSQAQKAVPWNESLFRGVVREYETLLPPPSPAIGLIESSSRPDSPTEAKTATFSVSSFCTCNKSNTTESDIFLNGADIQKSALPSATAVSRRTAQRAPFQPPTQSPMAVPESTWWPEQSVAANSAQLVQQQPVCTGLTFGNIPR